MPLLQLFDVRHFALKLIGATTTAAPISISVMERFVGGIGRLDG